MKSATCLGRSAVSLRLSACTPPWQGTSATSLRRLALTAWEEVLPAWDWSPTLPSLIPGWEPVLLAWGRLVLPAWGELTLAAWEEALPA